MLFKKKKKKKKLSSILQFVHRRTGLTLQPECFLYTRLSGYFSQGSKGSKIAGKEELFVELFRFIICH